MSKWFHITQATLAYGYQKPMTDDEWAWFISRAFPWVDYARPSTLLPEVDANRQMHDIVAARAYWAGPWEQKIDPRFFSAFAPPSPFAHPPRGWWLHVMKRYDYHHRNRKNLWDWDKYMRAAQDGLFNGR